MVIGTTKPIYFDKPPNHMKLKERKSIPMKNTDISFLNWNLLGGDTNETTHVTTREQLSSPKKDREEGERR